VSPAQEWSRCRPWIEAALPWCYGTHTIEDVERGIAEGRLQFWPGEKCACVTEIIEYPRLKALNFFLVGGDPTSPDGLRGAGLDELLNRMEPAVIAWAKALGCTRVASTGRKGWSKALKPLGYEHVLYTMLKEL